MEILLEENDEISFITFGGAYEVIVKYSLNKKSEEEIKVIKRKRDI